MATLKYDEFSYNGIRVNLRDALDPSLTDLRDEYNRDNLYCPECRVAKLKFTRKTNRCSAFLSTKQGSSADANEHEQECPYAIAPARKNQVKKYYRELTNKQIEDKLNAAINLYLRQANGGRNNPTLPREQNPIIMAAVENGRQVHRRLPKRSIYSIYGIDDSLLGIPVLLYGTAYLHVEDRIGPYGHYYHLKICKAPGTKAFHTIYRGGRRDYMDEEQLYYFSAIVIIRKSKNGGLNTKTYTPNAIRYLPVG